MATPRGYENLVECPYNHIHQVENGRRFQTHLIRCRREYEKSNATKKICCPFNSTHLINEPERGLHMESCPDRVAVDKFVAPIVDSVESLHRHSGAVKMVPEYLTVDEDDWDNDQSVPAYNPQKYCEKNNIIRSCNGMQPAQRKAFRQNEHLRLGNIREKK
ncbi:gametocyte-specific factor 1 homolog [Phlebotomus argentipes]|uniref:gametocyte-specific factor 1 homolog n=1 Tax=Phlebotomus argentipes TaxID=94469 RepID=UPI002892D829|nr:gametocyte-specific factor 1 homolog [Phlebotomus argentipes]